MSFTRREFSRLAGVGMLSQLLPNVKAQTSQGAQSTAGKTGYCIVGLGRISMDHFMPGVRQSSRSRITALVSGTS